MSDAPTLDTNWTAARELERLHKLEDAVFGVEIITAHADIDGAELLAHTA